MATDDKILRFALEQYGALINALNDKKCPFALLTQDDATFPEFPGITAANLRNVLIGGTASGTATYYELLMARVEYDAPCSKVEHLTLNDDGSRPISLYTQAPKYDVETFLLDRMQESTYIITQRIWSEDVQNKYIRKAADIPTGMLQKSVIRALFGVTRKERVAVYELQLPLDLRILLLNECIKICKVAKITPTNNQSSKITEAVAIRAYKRIVSDKKGATREDIDLFKETMDFPSALANEIQKKWLYRRVGGTCQF
jgi:hypothetical protein